MQEYLQEFMDGMQRKLVEPEGKRMLKVNLQQDIDFDCFLYVTKGGLPCIRQFWGGNGDREILEALHPKHRRLLQKRSIHKNIHLIDDYHLVILYYHIINYSIIFKMRLMK